jgi:hypothetical protein
VEARCVLSHVLGAVLEQAAAMFSVGPGLA